MTRGFLPTYHHNETNRCPGCTGVSWYVGRLSAECAFCGTAIPLADAHDAARMKKAA